MTPLNQSLKNKLLHSRVLSDFSEPVRAVLTLVEKNGLNESSISLVLCAASIGHPDHVVSLANLALIPAEYKKAALDLIKHALSVGLTQNEQAELLNWSENIIYGALRAP